MNQPLILPAITLYQPWATWIMRGWKTIETRTHNKFRALSGQTILIHAGLKTEPNAKHNIYLTRDQLLYKPEEIVNGFILGTAKVAYCDWLDDDHSSAALIDCHHTKRYGLFLTEITPFAEPIPELGSMGIWYYDLTNRKKIKKQKPQQSLF